MQEPTRATLAYGRRSKRRRLWWAAGVLMVLAIAVALWWGPTWRSQAAMLIDQRRCMTYRAPPDQVVYEGRRDENGICEKVTTCYAPRCWTRFKRRSAPVAVAFLHERTSPSGNRRLVCIAAEPVLSGTYVGLSVRPEWNFRVMVPAKLVGGPTDVPVFPYLEDDFLIGTDRVYAGQPDPADPSHFMIDYDDEDGRHEDGRHTVDGWLQDDDTLKFRFRGVEDAE